ncbi:MAG: long-chain fatty acid--CoA ligase [Bacteroidota bacterium]|nr:long-chain fatty acid--CoA ligase [Bacteroidota bacterium]
MVSRTFDIPEFCQREHPREDIFANKRNGKWRKISTSQYLNFSRLAGIGFLSLGLQKEDMVATVCSTNIPEWNFIDMGLARIGVIHVPVYPTISEESFEYIFRQSGVKYIFVSDQKVYTRIKPVLAHLPNLQGVYSFRKIKGLHTWMSIIQLGRKNKIKLAEKLIKSEQSIQEKDPATLIYTSGTTGKPKGVMLSHKNMVSNLTTASRIQPLRYKDKVLSFLPLSHVYERTSNYQFQVSGACLYYAEDISSIMKNLMEIKPHGFTAVPRVLEKIRSYYLNQGAELKGIQRYIFLASKKLASQYPSNHSKDILYLLRKIILNILVFKKIQMALGGRIKFIGCGGARLSPKIEKFFWTAGLPVYQGYGLTETSPLISLNQKESRHIGSVGPLIPGVEVKISEEREILVKGPNVMMTYYGEAELTREVIDDQGWFHTGDLGHMGKNNFLFIHGRKKELFKTSYGKYIAPQVIESRFRESELISQLMVVGEGEKFAGALVLPNFDFLFKWLRSIHQIHLKDRQKLIQLPQVHSLVENEINNINESLDSGEQIKNFQMVNQDWTILGGEFSPSLKLRRKFIMKKYESQVKAIYQA